MGGDIGVDSQPGAGSAFWFTVTLQKSADSTHLPQEMTHQSAEALLKTHFAGCKVLLAEDEPVNQRFPAACWKMPDFRLIWPKMVSKPSRWPVKTATT
jgi:hypothetical protein